MPPIDQSCSVFLFIHYATKEQRRYSRKKPNNRSANSTAIKYSVFTWGSLGQNDEESLGVLREYVLEGRSTHHHLVTKACLQRFLIAQIFEMFNNCKLAL